MRNPDGNTRAGPPPGARWPWVVATVALLVAAVVGIATSRGFDSVPVNDQIELLQPPDIAARMLDSTAASQAMGRDVYRVAGGVPSATKMLIDPSPMAADLRAHYLAAAWETRYFGVDGVSALRITVTEYRSDRFAASANPTCAPEHPEPVAGSDGVVGLQGESGRLTVACAEMTRGTQVVRVGVSVPHGADAVATARQVIQAQLTSLPESHADTPAALDFSTSRNALLRGWMLSLVVLTLLAWAPGALRDPARRGWLRSLRHRHPVSYPQISVDSAAQLLRWRVRALAMGRFAALVWTLRLTEVLPGFGIWLTTAAVLLVFLLLLEVQRRALGRWMPVHRRHFFTGGAVLVLVVGLVATCVLLTGAFGVWSFGNSMQLMGGASFLPTWQIYRFSVLSQMVAVVLVAASLLPLTLARRVAMTLARRTHRRTPLSPDTVVLLLRSFTDDRLRIRSRRVDRAGVLDRLALKQRDRFEEVLASAMSKWGPLIAVSTPGERLSPPLGAVRRQFSSDQWQQEVRDLADRSQAVVLVVGRSAGTVWEMEQLRDLGLLHKTVIVIPPLARKEQQSRLELVSVLFQVPWNLLWAPGTGQFPLALTWPVASEPQVFLARWRDDLAYDVALTAAAASLGLGDPAQPLASPLAASGVPATGSWTMGEGGPFRGSPQVIPAGGYQPWRIPLALKMYGASMIVTIATALLTWAAFGYVSDQGPAGVHFQSQGMVSVVGGSSQAATIVDGTRALTVRFDEGGSGDVVSEESLPAEVTEAVMVGDVVYWVSGFTGQVGAHRLGGGDLWTVATGPGARGLSADPSGVYLLEPASRRLLVLDPGTGAQRRSEDLPGVPWDSAVADGQIAVALIDQPVLLTARLATGEDLATVVLRSPASQVFFWQGQWWVVVDDSRHILDSSGGTPRPFTRTNPLGPVTADTQAMAVVGVDQVRVFDDHTIRVFLTGTEVEAIGLLQDHTLVTVEPGRITWRPGSTAAVTRART